MVLKNNSIKICPVAVIMKKNLLLLSLTKKPTVKTVSLIMAD
jgi:hypothetical protein